MVLAGGLIAFDLQKAAVEICQVRHLLELGTASAGAHHHHSGPKLRPCSPYRRAATIHGQNEGERIVKDMPCAEAHKRLRHAAVRQTLSSRNIGKDLSKLPVFHSIARRLFSLPLPSDSF